MVTHAKLNTTRCGDLNLRCPVCLKTLFLVTRQP